MRITSPNGHFVSVTNDSAGRITRVDDDAKRWVSYQYDSAGALVKSGNWRGDAQDFRYDAQVNMTRVEESGTDDKGPYNFTINNTFDEQNRFKGQTVSTGTFLSAQYVTDDKSNVTQVNVGGPEGLSRYFFNEFRLRDAPRISAGQRPGMDLRARAKPKFKCYNRSRSSLPYRDD